MIHRAAVKIFIYWPRTDCVLHQNKMINSRYWVYCKMSVINLQSNFWMGELHVFHADVLSHVWLEPRHLFLKTLKPRCISKHKRRLCTLGIWLAVCVGGFSSHWATDDISNIKIKSAYHPSAVECWNIFFSVPLGQINRTMKSKHFMTLTKYCNVYFRQFTEAWCEIEAELIFILVVVSPLNPRKSHLRPLKMH